MPLFTPPQNFCSKSLRGLILFSLVLQLILPVFPAPLAAAPLLAAPLDQDDPPTEPPPADSQPYTSPFADLLPAAEATATPALDAAAVVTPALTAELFLQLDREVLIAGETAQLTLTVQGKYASDLTGLEVALTLPAGLQTAAGETGVLHWSVPTTPDAPPFVQSLSLQVDSASLPAATAVLTLAALLSAPGYDSVYSAARLGITPDAGSNEPVVTAPQGATGAVLQVGDGLLTLLVEPDAATPDTRFVYSELYRWDHAPVTITTPITLETALTTTTMLTLTPALTATAPVTMTTPVTAASLTTATTTSAVNLPLVVGPTIPITQSLNPSVSQSLGLSVSQSLNLSVSQSPVSAAAQPDKPPKPKEDEGVQMYFVWQLDAQTGNHEVKEFKKPVQVNISLAQLAAAGLEVSNLQLWTRSEEKARWTPVRTDYDAKRQVLTAFLPHFSQFGLGAGLSQQGEILPSTIGFTTDRLTGAVNLNVPIVTPAGVGGLNPNLSFGYSSSAGDDFFLDSGWQYLSQSSGVGYGWGVSGSNNFIVRTDGNLDNNYPDTWKSFSVMLNGIRANIRYEENAWRTDPETFYAVYWAGTDQTGANAVTDWGGWTLIARDGVKYEFGDAGTFAGYSTTSPTAVYLEATTGGNTYRLAKQWYLRRVYDPKGNRIEYIYKTEQGLESGCINASWPSGDRWYTRAVYPDEIQWSGNLYTPLANKLRVTFAYEAVDRQDWDIKDNGSIDCKQVKFAKRDRLTSVTVQAGGSGAWQTLRSYALSQSYGTYNEYDANNNYLRQVKRSQLDAIAVRGKNSGALQTHSFTYQAQSNLNPNQIHILTANNGWGGKATYTLTGHRPECSTSICGQNTWRGTRMAATRVRLEDGLSNSIYTDYYYGPPNDPVNEWGRVGIEDGGGQFFGFKESQATYYAAVGGSTLPSVVLKWDKQEAWPGAQDNPDPRAGKPKRIEVRTANGGALLSVQNINWVAYRRVSGAWVSTVKNHETNNNVTTFPIIWVRQESEDMWAAGGAWSGATYSNNDNGVGKLTRYVFDNTASYRGYGNVVQVDELSHSETLLGQATWATRVSGNTGLTLLRQTYTDFFPSATSYIVNKPGRMLVYNGSGSCQSEVRTIYDSASGATSGNYTTPPTYGLPTRIQQALSACSSTASIADSNSAWAVTVMSYDAYSNQIQNKRLGASSSQDVTLNTSFETTYNLFPTQQDLNGSATYRETARYYGINETSGYSGVAIWGAMQEHCGVNDACTRQTYDEFGRRAHRWEAVGAGSTWGSDANANVRWSYNMYGASGLNRSVISEWRAPRCYGNFVRRVYNGLGQLIQEQKPQQSWGANVTTDSCSPGNNLAEVDVNYDYDALGNQTYVSTPVATIASWINRALVWNSYTRINYNGLSQIIQSIAPNGEQTQYTYGGRATAVIGLGRNGDPNKTLKWSETDGWAI